MKAGVFLDNPIEQQNYISSNYTHIARDMLANGVNVLAQLVARKVIDGRTFLSLSCNPDVSPTIVPVLRQMEAQQGYKVAEVRPEDRDKCTGCASCALICPDLAITVWRSKKSKGGA